MGNQKIKKPAKDEKQAKDWVYRARAIVEEIVYDAERGRITWEEAVDQITAEAIDEKEWRNV